MYVIKEVLSADEKSCICFAVLTKLHDWFGNEQSISEYVKGVCDKPMFGAFEDNVLIGFASLAIHNQFTSEIYVIGVFESHHNQGVGRALIEACVEFCQNQGTEFLTVKTLDESANYLPYEKTRLFYLSMGFCPLQVFPLFWDADNPCLLMVKYLGKV